MPSCAAFSRATDVNAEASPESERVQGAAMALEGHEAVHWVLHRILGGVHVGIDRADYTMLTVMPVSAKSRGRPRHPLRHGLGGLDGRVGEARTLMSKTRSIVSGETRKIRTHRPKP